MPTIKMTKQELIDAMKAEIPKATKRDERTLAKHRRDVDKARKLLDKRIAESASWTDEQWEENNWEVGITYQERNRLQLSCPISEVGQIERLIAEAELSGQTSYTLQESDWRTGPYYSVVTKSMPRVGKVC